MEVRTTCNFMVNQLWLALLRRGISLGFILLFIPSVLSAQQVVNSTSLLSGLNPSPANAILQRGISFLKEGEQGMPMIDELEFRTETDELEFNRQEYLFRVSFNNKKTREAQDKITEQNLRLFELREGILKEAELAQRYEWIIEWFYLQKETDYNQKRGVILEDKKTVYEKMLLNTETPDISDLLSIDEDLQEHERTIFELKNQQQFLIKQLTSGQDTSVTLDTRQWISLETMHFVLKDAMKRNTFNLEQKRQQLRIDSEQLELDLEEAKRRKILDFVQLKYAGRNNLDIQKEFSFGLGLQIPTRSTNRLNINEALLDKLDEEFEKELLDQEIEHQLLALMAEFNALYKEGQLINQQIAESRFAGLFEKYQGTTNLHPIALLNIKELELKNQRSLFRIERKACQLYLDILRLKGMLDKTPATNYLSDALQEF